MSPPPGGTGVADQHQRDAAVQERARNVVIEAGAGTGKTTVLVRRLVNLIAPQNGGAGVPIERIAAITFTRRAAGELRFRVREEILRGLSSADNTPQRRDQLRAAFAGLDTAHIGTIHSFADRLLRLRPVEAALSPSYEVAEDDEPLIQETFVRLMHAVETEALDTQLAGATADPSVIQATTTILKALRANLRAESRETEYWTFHGLNGLVAEFVRKRDVPPRLDAAASEFDATAFREATGRILEATSQLVADTRGSQRLRSVASAVERVATSEDPAEILRELNYANRELKNLQKGTDFPGDLVGWKAVKAVRLDPSQTSLLEEALTPSRRFLAQLLVALFPVVIALYERVKAEHQVVDQVDLLLKLRDLLASNLKVRRFYQGLFDHVFVDEFQDTDPLQAEILLYLCEAEAKADNWQKVVVGEGRLTTVGDPKQSIYRFRRADVAMYDAVRRRIEQGPTLVAKLSVNFRSAGGLIDWFDACFADLLGTPPVAGESFNAATGEVYHQALQAYRASHQPAHVHVLPFELQGNGNVEQYRALEAEALAHYLRWLIEVRRFPVVDSITKAERPLRFGDVAILAMATPMLDPLFPELDRMGIPFVRAGGRLFLEDALHRQFILGLRAIADPSDGIAQAALFRPPFFAVDLGDHVRAKVAGDHTSGRLREARDLVAAIRQARFDCPPGHTARDLLEKTAFARSVSLGANGPQRISALRELCIELETIAAVEGLDYDAVTARMREWVVKPIPLDPPPVLASQAVQVMTVHQAKGLEFPVVVLWDGRGLLAARIDQSAWVVDNGQTGWSLALDGLPWTEPPGLGLRARDKQYADAERKRIVYVAATRARDLLVVPKAGQPTRSSICGRLLNVSPGALVEELDVYRQGEAASWAAGITAPVYSQPGDDIGGEKAILTRWESAAKEARRPRFNPVNVTSEAHSVLDTDTESLEGARKRSSRFGPIFGDTVHRAIGLAIRDRSIAAAEAVERAAYTTGLAEHYMEAGEDVARTIATLEREGLIGAPDLTLQLEYPVAAAEDQGKLIVGYVDLVCLTERALYVIDFKTDLPPALGGEPPDSYAKQVATYARLLGAPWIRGERNLRSGLLYTASGDITWLGSTTDASGTQ